jgi:hypothetical protein
MKIVALHTIKFGGVFCSPGSELDVPEDQAGILVQMKAARMASPVQPAPEPVVTALTEPEVAGVEDSVEGTAELDEILGTTGAGEKVPVSKPSRNKKRR